MMMMMMMMMTIVVVMMMATDDDGEDDNEHESCKPALLLSSFLAVNLRACKSLSRNCTINLAQISHLQCPLLTCVDARSAAGV
eukprot:1660148-Rhodomonas_salina.1